MTTAKTLIKVTDGLYRSDCGGITVMQQYGWRRTDRGKYLARWYDGLGARKEEYFATLRDVRNKFGL